MKNIVFVFIIFTYLSISQAQVNTYGYLRTTVIQTNPEHTTQISLILNSAEIASFSHSMGSPTVLKLSSNLLSEGTSTSLSSNYNRLQKGCEFDFRIEFSFDQITWIQLGVFGAPTHSVNVSLPIGKCNGSVCSSNRTIQNQIKKAEEIEWKKNEEFLKKTIEDAIQNQINALEELELDFSELELESPSLRNDISHVRNDFDSLTNSKPQQPSITSYIPTIDDITNHAINSNSLDNVLFQENMTASFIDECLRANQYTQYFCSKYGSMGWVVSASHVISTALSTNPEAAINQLNNQIANDPSAQKLTSWKEKNIELRFQLQAAIDYKRFQETWGEVSSKARTALTLTPINDVLDLCEMLTGRETCLETGRLLSSDERLFAAAGVIVGNRLLWKGLADNVKGKMLDEIIPVDAVDLNNIVIKDARAVNDDLAKIGYTRPPYLPDDKTAELPITKDLAGIFVRFYGGDSALEGRWIISKKSVEGLTPTEISKELNLNYIPQYIGDVTIRAGSYLRRGIVNPVSNDEKRIIQYEILKEKLPKNTTFESLFIPRGEIK